jgi:hypothetical protein
MLGYTNNNILPQPTSTDFDNAMTVFSNSQSTSNQFISKTCKFNGKKEPLSKLTVDTSKFKILSTKFTNIEANNQYFNNDKTAKKGIQMIFTKNDDFTSQKLVLRIKITERNFAVMLKKNMSKQQRRSVVHKRNIVLKLDDNMKELSSSEINAMITTGELKNDYNTIQNKKVFMMSSIYDHGDLGISGEDILRIRIELHYHDDIDNNMIIGGCMKILEKDYNMIKSIDPYHDVHPTVDNMKVKKVSSKMMQFDFTVKSSIGV